MKMRRFAVCLVLVMFASLLSGPVLLAQNEEEWDAEEGGDDGLPEAGVLPGSPLYFVKRLGETLRLGLIRAPEGKAEYIAHLMEIRLAEAEALVGKGRPKLLERTLERYDDLATRGMSELGRAGEGGRDLTDALLAFEAATRKSHGVLNGIMEQVPEQARQAIRTALQASNRGREAALQVMEKVMAGEAPGRPDAIDEFLTGPRGRSRKQDPGGN